MAKTKKMLAGKISVSMYPPTLKDIDADVDRFNKRDGGGWDRSKVIRARLEFYKLHAK